MWGRHLGQPRSLDQVTGNRAIHDAQYFAHDLRLTGKQKAQGIGNAQHPLADGKPGQYFIYQQRSTLNHASGVATRTEPTAFAAEGHELFRMAFLAGVTVESRE